MGILILFFLDAIREMQKYSAEETQQKTVGMSHLDTQMQMHMRLFRAQRMEALEMLILAEMKAELEKAKKEAEAAKKDMNSMKSQSESLAKEYDRLMEEKDRLQRKVNVMGEDKKDD